MKRILLVTHAGGSPRFGPNMRWYYLAQALAQFGVEVEIVSSSFFHKYTSLPHVTENGQTTFLDGIRYHWIKTRPYTGRGFRQVLNQIEFTLRATAVSRSLAERRPDIVVASSPHPLVVFPAVAVAKRANARFVYEVRDLWPELLLELGGFRKWHPYILLLKAAESYAVRRAERVLSVKPGDIYYFASEYALPLERYSYIPNGFLAELDEHSAPSMILELRSRYRFIVGYVGAISAYYGLDRLICLAERFHGREDVGFVVVGKGNLLEGIRDAAKLKKLKHVHFVGAISKREVAPTLACFDVCYLGLEDLAINRFGISCNKIYEYMHARKPIIASYRVGFDPVESARCGFVAAPGDYDTLAKGIESLATDQELATRMGERGKAYFDEHHDFSKVAGRLQAVLFPEVGIVGE